MTNPQPQGTQEARTLHEIAYYPPHVPRAEDPQHAVFEASRHHLIDVLGIGCWIGGATAAQIGHLPPDHPCARATQLEAHHHIAELAGLNALDWQKVAADFPNLGIDSDETMQRAANAEGGLMILCDVHHRAPGQGVHMITGPVWTLGRYSDGWQFTHPA